MVPRWPVWGCWVITSPAFVEKSARASAETGMAALQRWVKRHKLGKFVTLTLEERCIVCAIDVDAQAEDAWLDGCYWLETDVPKALLDAKTVDERYRDLQKVERNFRTVKTTFLEIRPIFLQLFAKNRPARKSP